MPRKKKSYTLAHKVVSRKNWILYSSNRQFCFLNEIQLGYFSPNYSCGCATCDKQLVPPEPSFTPRPGEVRAGQPKS